MPDLPHSPIGERLSRGLSALPIEKQAQAWRAKLAGVSVRFPDRTIIVRPKPQSS